MVNHMKFLAKVPLFTGLSEKQLNKLATRFVTRNFGVGEHIVTQGRGGAGLFIIVEGSAEAVVETGSGEKIQVNTFGETDFFGEIALLDDGPRTASVIATEATKCLVLSREDFVAVLKNDAELGLHIAEELARRLRRVVGAM